MAQSNQTQIFKCDYHATHVANKLNTLYEEKELLDVTIVAGIDKVALGAHRVVLSASSDYFRAMFRSSFKEAKSESFELSEVDGETLKAVLDFMYSASIVLHIETVENILKTADLLQLSTLIAGCCDFMVEQLDQTNCIGIALLAEQRSYSELHEKSLLYVFKNFRKVVEEEEFRELDVLQLNNLFQHNLQKIPQEDLFLGMVAWLKHDETKRGQFMHRLLSNYINLESLNPKFVIRHRNPIFKISDCFELLYSWLDRHLPDEDRKDKIIYATCTDTGLLVRSYCPHCNKWTLEDWPQPKQWRISYSAAIINKKFIIAGGTDRGVATNTVECLDIHRLVWSNLPSMSVARSEFGMAELNGNLYAIGGYACWTREKLLTVEKYDLENSKMWEAVPSLPLALTCPKAVALRGKLYVLGNGELSLVCYDPTTKEWTQTASKSEKSSSFGLVSLKGHLYVIGGKLQSGEISKTVERYNPLSNTWTVEKSMAQARISPACCAWNNRILACGGGDEKKFLKTHCEYDCQTKMWKSLANCDIANEKPFNTAYRASELFSIL